jgi:hypothetical protein
MSNQGAKCSQEEILKITDTTIKKAGYKLETLNKEIIEKDTFFLIYYFSKNINRRGGDVDVKVSKQTCKIIEMNRYQ